MLAANAEYADAGESENKFPLDFPFIVVEYYEKTQHTLIGCTFSLKREETTRKNMKWKMLFLH